MQDLFSKFKNFSIFFEKKFKKVSKCINPKCSNYVQIFKLNFGKKSKFCNVCRLSSYKAKFKKWNLINREFLKKNINLSDVHFDDTLLTSLLILENNHIFIYAIESLEFLLNFFHPNFKQIPQKGFQKKIKIYQRFLFFIKSKEISNYISSIFFNKNKFKENKKRTILIDLILQICELFDTWKNDNSLFYTVENEKKIAQILKEIKKYEPFILKLKRYSRKIKFFFGFYPTHILIMTTFITNLVTILIVKIN